MSKITIGDLTIDVKTFNDDCFKRFKEFIYSKGLAKYKRDDDCVAVGINIDDCCFIIIHEKVLKMSKDLQRIIIAHECGHVVGLEKTEEKADRWALGALNKKQRKLLIDMWPKRHGHDYKEK
jgi:hypothetical protein